MNKYIISTVVLSLFSSYSVAMSSGSLPSSAGPAHPMATGANYSQQVHEKSLGKRGAVLHTSAQAAGPSREEIHGRPITTDAKQKFYGEIQRLQEQIKKDNELLRKYRTETNKLRLKGKDVTAHEQEDKKLSQIINENVQKLTQLANKGL